MANYAWSRVVGIVAVLLSGCADDGGERSSDADGIAADSGSSDDDASESAVGNEDGGTTQADGGGVRGDAGTDGGRYADGGRMSDASIQDVDLTLGGFNQDLPAPSVDCVNKQSLVLGCMALSGTYNGTPFALSCEESKLTVGMTSGHLLSCRGAVTGGDLVVELHLDPKLIFPPTTLFSVTDPTPTTYVSIWHLQRMFASYPDGTFALAQTHDQSVRVSGISEVVQRGTPSLPREDWRIRGAFSLSLTPKGSCMPTGMSSGCDTVKLRANFSAYPIE